LSRPDPEHRFTWADNFKPVPIEDVYPAIAGLITVGPKASTALVKAVADGKLDDQGVTNAGVVFDEWYKNRLGEAIRQIDAFAALPKTTVEQRTRLNGLRKILSGFKKVYDDIEKNRIENHRIENRSVDPLIASRANMKVHKRE
jgi:hypothetical protein